MFETLFNAFANNEKETAEAQKKNTYALSHAQLETCVILQNLVAEAAEKKDESDLLEILGRLAFAASISKESDADFSDLIKDFAKVIEWYINTGNPRKGEYEKRMRACFDQHRIYFHTKIGGLKAAIDYQDRKHRLS